MVCALVLPLVMEQMFPAADPRNRKLSAILIGMILGLAVIRLDSRGLTGRPWISLCSAHSLNVLLTVGGVALFQDLLEASRLIPLAARELLGLGIPSALVVALLPLAAGLITGVASGFAGLSFPLVVGLMASPGSGLTPMSTLVLAFGFGYMGMMLSPIHLCILVTREYFSTSLRGMYALIVPCAMAMLVFTLLFSAALRWLGW